MAVITAEYSLQIVNFVKSKGWVPILLKGKKPIINNWQTATQAIGEKWCIDASKKKVYFGLQSHDFKKEIGNQYNVDVVCGINSNLCVINIDTKNDGLKIWKTLLRNNIDSMLLSPNINIFNILNTFTVKTGRGGYYYYFKYTKCEQLKNHIGLLKCIDIRT